MEDIANSSSAELHSYLATLDNHPKETKQNLLLNIARETITQKRPDLFGVTLLHGLDPLKHSKIWYAAIQNPDATFVRKLVEIGKQRPGTVNGRYGGTLISNCIAYNNVDAVKYLFGSHGASFHDNGDDDSHDFDLWRAADRNPGASTELKDYLSGKVKDATYDMNRACALHDAAVRERVELMQTLVQNGADVDSACRHHLPNAMHGCPPLHYAVEARKLGSVRWLLDRGADPRAQCKTEGGLRGHLRLKYYPFTDWEEGKAELEARGFGDVWRNPEKTQKSWWQW